MFSGDKEDIYLETESVEAYAKLQGPGVKEIITKKTVIIGREPGEQTEEEQKIIFNDSQKISRQHLKIFWDMNNQEWKIQSLSKNKIFVNKMLIKKEDPPITLKPCAAIKFDKYHIYCFPAY